MTTWVPAQDVAAAFGLVCFSPRCLGPAAEANDCNLASHGPVLLADEWRTACNVNRLRHAARSRVAWLPSGQRQLEFDAAEIYLLAAALSVPTPDGYPDGPMSPEPTPPELWQMMPPIPVPPPPFAPVGVEAPPRLAHGDQSVVETAIQRHKAVPLKSAQTFADPDWRRRP